MLRVPHAGSRIAHYIPGHALQRPPTKRTKTSLHGGVSNLYEAKAAARDAAKQNGGKFEVLDGNGKVVAVEG